MLKKWAGTVIIGIGLAVSAWGFGYFLYQPEAEEPEQRISITPEKRVVLLEDAEAEYIYKYNADGITETAVSPVPPYLVGLTKEEAANKLAGFEILSFDAEKITVLKRLEGESRQHYILGERDGYLAVFYKKGNGLKEMTNTPVSALSDEELAELGKNEIVGSDKLARILEDLES